MSSEAKVSISMLEGKIEFSGSENFVKEQLSFFKSIIETTLKRTQHPDVMQSPAVPYASPTIQPSTNFVRVFDLTGDQIKIIAKAPGKNNAEKSVNLSLLYLLAKRLKEGEELALASELREVCKEHAVLDASNFMKYLRSQKLYFNISGSKKSLTVKLTFPGTERATELATELNS